MSKPMNPRDKIGPSLESAKDLEPRPRGNRKRCTFRQRDLRAALQAAKQAGQDVSQVIIDPDGRITIMTGAPAAPEAKPEPVNTWLELARKR